MWLLILYYVIHPKEALNELVHNTYTRHKHASKYSVLLSSSYSQQKINITEIVI